MGCAEKRGRRCDRYREIPGEGTRRKEKLLAAKRAARQAKRHALSSSTWGGATRARSTRVLRTHVLQHVQAFQNLSQKNADYAAEMLRGLISHPTMGKVKSIAKLKSNREQLASDLLVSNMHTSYQDVKRVRGSNHLIAKHTTLNMSVSSEMVEKRLVSATARLLGMPRANMQLAATRRDKILQQPPQERVWASKGRCQRSDRYSAELRKYVVDFWHMNTRPSPKAKDIIKRVQKHYLLVSQTELYTSFVEHYASEGKFPGTVCPGQRFFEHLKPFYIYQEEDRSVCCCKYHVELNMLKNSFNELRRGSHNSACSCLCSVCVGHEEALTDTQARTATRCHASSICYDSVRAMCSDTLCPKEVYEPLSLDLHNPSCVLGTCQDCNFDLKFPICSGSELDEDPNAFAWSCFEQVPGSGLDSNGKAKTRLGKVRKLTSKTTFVEYLKVKIADFVKHDFVYRWQDRQFKQSMAIFPVGTILSVIDYAENYTLAPQDEIQSEYWTSTQVTILVHIVYYHEPDSTYTNRKIGKVVHYYISDDRKHDSVFVQHAFRLLDSWLHAEGIEFQQHWVWSDGAPTQFKNQIALFFVSRYTRISGGKRMMWAFFAAGHGKGEHDGMGAIVKRWLRRYQRDRKGLWMQNAADAVRLLQANFSLGTRSTFHKRQKHQDGIRRIFHHVEVGAVDRISNLNCDTIQGTRNKIFQVMGTSQSNHTLLHSRPLACFCPTCVYGSFENCMNSKYTGGQWTEHNLVPKGPLPPDCEMPWGDLFERDSLTQVGSDYNHLSNALEVGSYFAIRSIEGNEECSPYWILRCTHPLETLVEERTHVWDNTTFLVGETVVTGTFMKKAGKTPRKYKWDPNKDPATVLSHLVIAIDLPLCPEDEAEKRRFNRSQNPAPRNVVYNLPEEDHEAMLQQLAEPSDIFDVIQ